MIKDLILLVVGAIVGGFIMRKNPLKANLALDELQAKYDALKAKYEPKL